VKFLIIYTRKVDGREELVNQIVNSVAELCESVRVIKQNPQDLELIHVVRL
jgi:hypothetical protein